jgi:predicted HicB family RNase H-like nuclease
MKNAVSKKKSETKILTGFRINPQLKALAMEAAQQENRSLSNYLENLILKDVKGRGSQGKK